MVLADSKSNQLVPHPHPPRSRQNLRPKCDNHVPNAAERHVHAALHPLCRLPMVLLSVFKPMLINWIYISKTVLRMSSNATATARSCSPPCLLSRFISADASVSAGPHPSRSDSLWTTSEAKPVNITQKNVDHNTEFTMCTSDTNHRPQLPESDSITVHMMPVLLGIA